MKSKKLEEIIEFNPTENLKNGAIAKKISMDKLNRFYKYINSYDIEKYNGGVKFRNGDTLLAKITPCLENGKTSKVTILDKDEIGFGSKEYIVMRSKRNISDADFVFYLAISPEFRKIAIKSMTGTSGRQRVQLNIIKNTEMLIPDYDNQVKIGKILSSIDSKIELNKQINSNLKKLIENYISSNFKGNKLGSANELGYIQRGYPFKSKDLKEDITKNKILKISNITGTLIDISNTQYIEDSVVKKIDNKFKAQRGNVIVAMSGTELGKTGYIYGKHYKYYLNQRVGLVVGNSKKEELYLNCIFLSTNFQQKINNKGYGSAQPNISSDDIGKINIYIPDNKELNDFYKFANELYKKIIKNSEENLNLERLRDTLLPKLMNGEISLNNIEI